ncbi:HAD family hydrolase [Flagellimonas sp.]|uniref:HAD family hydrolase n=1 Tax=Flagellimonas sp. TaxID=2058762 RepID=UPI003B5A09E5
MTFKILCSDLDGTLLSTKSDVSEFTVSQIHRIKERMRIILVSARMPKSMVYLQKRMGIEKNPIICYNGALVMQEDKQLNSTIIPIDLTAHLNNICKAHNIKLGLYHKDEWCVGETSERVQKEILHTKAEPLFEPTFKTLERWEKKNIGAHKIMLMSTKPNIDAISSELESNFSSEVNCYRSNDTLIEIAPNAVSKLLAIQSLLQPNESLEDVLAFGDNYNDIEMLQCVGYGVAVENGRKEVKEIAKKVTLSNKDHGVAQFIKDHL